MEWLTGVLVTGLAGLSIWLWQQRGALCVRQNKLSGWTDPTEGKIALKKRDVCVGNHFCISTFLGPQYFRTL